VSQTRGWIKLHRDIREHWIYKENRKYSKFEAWTWLLMDANHKDNKVLYNNTKLVDVKRGETLTSEVKLSKLWGWGRKKVRRFLELLEEDNMIVKKVEPNQYIIIGILNYDKFQSATTDDTTQNIVNTYVEQCTTTTDNTTEEQQRNNQGTTEEQPRNTNKNVKNVKNDKKKEIEESVPYDEIRNLFNEICESLPKVRSITQKRKPHIKARWEQFNKDMSVFKDAFNKLERSSFCTGSNERGWKANFDWLIKNDTNMVKVLERKYENNKPSNGNKVKTKFHNFEQRTSRYAPKELEDKIRNKFKNGAKCDEKS